jgi:hypothetical protein
MRASRTLALVGSLAAAACIVGQASAANGAATFTRCTWHARVQGGIYTVRGAMVGSVKCTKPLGAGGFHARYRDNITPPTASETASPRFSLRSGTLRGSLQVSGIMVTTHYQGVFHITGGSERFKHASGSLHLSCVVHPPFETCTASGAIAGI